MTLKRNILAGWLAHVVTLVIGFVLMPYVLDTLEESQYGAWLFINAVAGYSGLVYAGFGATICRYVADLSAREDWRKLNYVVSSIQGVYMVAATIVLAMAGVFAWLAPLLDKWGDLPTYDIRVAILIVGATIAIGMVCSVFGGVLVGTQRLDVKRGIDVCLGILRLALVLLLLKREQGLITLALIFFAVTLVEQILFMIFAYRQIPTISVGPWNIDRQTLRECFGFSAFNAVALVAEQLIFFTDTVVIGVVLGPVAVVPYQIALRVAQMIQAPIAQIGEAVLPKAGQLHATRAASGMQWLVARAMGLAFLLAGGFLIGATYFGGMLIEVWIGRGYPISEKILCILVGAQVVSLPMIIARKALLGAGDVRIPAFIDLLEAVINLALSLILIQWLGIVGVAWGTFIPLVFVELSLLLPYAANRLGLDARKLAMDILRPAALPLALLLGYCEYVARQSLTANWITLLAITSGGGIVLGTGVLLTSFFQSRGSATAPQPMS